MIRLQHEMERMADDSARIEELENEVEQLRAALRPFADADLWCDTCAGLRPHRRKPSPEAGPFWRCSECGSPFRPNSDPGDIDAAVAMLGKLATKAAAMGDAPPSGNRPPRQVAEDERCVRLVLDDVKPHPDDVGTPLSDADAALSRLVAKAQGYEAAVADNAALLGVLRRWLEADGDAETHDIKNMTAKQRAAFVCYLDAHDVSGRPHPGTALLEQHRTAVDGIHDVLDAASRYDDKPHHLYSAVRRLAETCGGDDVQAVVAQMDVAYDHHDRHRKEVEALRAIVDGLASEMERTLKYREQTGGMRVPDHGDFASAPPSMLGRLRWWTREMREALGGNASAILVRARNDGLEKAAGFMENWPEAPSAPSGIRAMKEPEQ